MSRIEVSKQLLTNVMGRHLRPLGLKDSSSQDLRDRFLTVLWAHGLMVLPSYGLTALPSYGLTVSWPYGLTVSRSYGLTASRLYE